MDIPNSVGQLAIALFLVTPGVVYQLTRSRLRGPTPDDASATNRILRALAFSAALNGIYAIVAGPNLYRMVSDSQTHLLSWSGALEHLRSIGWLALLLYLIVPAVIAAAGAAMTKYFPRLRNSWPQLPRLSYDPTPRAWDWAFSRTKDTTYVRILTTDGRWIGGRFGEDSFVSSYPEPREMFVESAWRMDDDGNFVEAQPNSAGMYLRCDDIRSVEFISPQVSEGNTVAVDITAPAQSGEASEEHTT